MPFLEVENLSFSYPKSENTVLGELEFFVNQGDFVLVMGKSGSGKSTLLKLLKKEIAPTGRRDGTIRCDADNIGFVFQNPQQSMVTDRVRSELAFRLENIGTGYKEITAKIAETSAYFNLSHLLEREIATLSGGEKQLLSLASVMIGTPDLLILDEPTAHLDPAMANNLLHIVERLNRELGVTVIMSTHTPKELLETADSVLLLDGGNMLFFGTPHDSAGFLKEQKHDMLHAMPASVRLFDDAPLSVKESLPFAKNLCEKPLVPYRQSDTALKIKDICFAYERNAPEILYDLSYKAEKGKINAIVGENGGGKSTLLKIIAGVLKPYRGKVHRKTNTSLLSQNVHYLFTKETVSKEIGMDTAQRLGITHILAMHPFDLSEGQARLAAIGMQLETGADILLMDEPTSSLDAHGKIELAKLLSSLCDEGKTIILVSHDLDFVGRYAHNVAFLCAGELSAPMPRRLFFSSLNLYTTEVRRITRGILDYAVSEEDVE